MTAAIVLSAGFGTRLRPLTDELAKPLIPVGDRPVLAHAVDKLRAAGIDRVAVNIHHLASDFTSKLRSFDLNVEVLHESEILGTAGGVANAAAVLGPGEVVVWNGDIWAPDLELGGVLRHFAAARPAALWLIERAPCGQGTVGVDARGHLVRLRGEVFGHEVSGGEYLGIQVLSAELGRRLPDRGCMVADVALPWLRAGGVVETIAEPGEWHDIGSLPVLLRANLRWLERRGARSWVAPDARVAPGVRLAHAVVGAGAEIIGEGEVAETVVLPGATLEAPCKRMVVGRTRRAEVA